MSQKAVAVSSIKSVSASLLLSACSNEAGQPEAAHTPDRSANENQDQSQDHRLLTSAAKQLLMVGAPIWYPSLW